MVIEIPSGSAILGAPTTGKTTLQERNPDLRIVDQDEIKIELNNAVNPFPVKKRAAMWTKLAAILAEGGVVTYSDYDLEFDDRSSDAKYVKQHTVISFSRSNAEMKRIMSVRDGSVHPDVLKWTFEWHRLIAPIHIVLDDGKFIGDYVLFIEE